MTVKKEFLFTVLLVLLSSAYGQQASRPQWVDDLTAVPKNTGLNYFVGISKAGDRNQAREDAETQASNSFGVTVERWITDISSLGKNPIGEGFLAGREQKGGTSFFSQAKNIQLKDEAWYSEGGTVYGLFSLSPARAISEEYKPFVEFGASQPVLTDKLWVYGAVLAELDRNPEHKKLAYQVEDKIPLYQYLAAQIREIPKTITLETDNWMQVGDALEVRAHSNAAEKVGDLKCRIKMGNSTAEYALDANDTFYVTETMNLKDKKDNYTLQYELLFGQEIVKSGKIIFMVVPLLAYIDFIGSDLNDAEKRMLANSVQRGLRDNRVPVQTLVKYDRTGSDLGNYYAIVVTVDFLAPRQTFSRENFIYTISVSLQKNNIEIETAVREPVEHHRRDFLMKAANDFILNNKEFFTQVASHLEGVY